MTDPSARRFLIAVMAGWFLISAPVVALAARLLTIGEVFVVDPRPRVELHGPLFSDYPSYKFAITRQILPDVLVLGSSRVDQLRVSMFSRCATGVCFYNANGAAPDLRAALQFMTNVAAVDAPDVLLLGLDIWQFNPAWEPSKHEPLDALRVSPLARAEYAFAATRLVGYVALRDPAVRAALLTAAADGRVEGLQALARGTGFRADGSWRSDATDGSVPNSASRSAELVREVREGIGHFPPFTAPDRRSLAELDAILELAARSGTRVVLFVPPVSEEVAAALRASPSAIAALDATASAIRERAALRGVPFHWPLAMTDAGCDPDEHFDGFHLTEVCTAHLLMQLLERPDSGPILARYADVDQLRSAVRAAHSWMYLDRSDR